jgi:hypothetical protein
VANVALLYRPLSDIGRYDAFLARASPLMRCSTTGASALLPGPSTRQGYTSRREEIIASAELFGKCGRFNLAVYETGTERAAGIPITAG